MADRRSDQPPDGSKGQAVLKPAIVVALIAIAGSLAYFFGDYLNLDYLAGRESQLRDFQQEHPLLVYALAFVVYVVATGLSLPGAAALSLLFAWFFGFLPALVLISFASTTGATVAMLISRYLLRSSVQRRFGERLRTVNAHLESEGPYYLFTLRLIPLVPFFVINLVMGLTPIRTWTYWWVSQLGMLPGTAVYVYAGSQVPQLETLADEGVKATFTSWQLFQLFVAFGLLAIFPTLARWLVRHFGNKSTLHDTTEGPER